MDDFDQVKLTYPDDSQLQKDGYPAAASAVSAATLTPERKGMASNRLEQLVRLGLMVERERGINAAALTADASHLDLLASVRDIKGVDFDTEPKERRQTLRANFQTKFVTVHKNSCRCATFSPDGKFVATGSADTSVKLLDVSKVVSHGQPKGDTVEEPTVSRPLVKTFYDHTQTINDLAFHPTQTFLASASKDCTIRVYDFSSSAKKTKYMLQDSHSVRTITYHPSGEYILAGTDQPQIRLYDVREERGFISPKQHNIHHGAINQLRYSPDGKIFVSCSKDGSIKLWDGVSNTCFHTIPDAHSGNEVSSVQFSRNMKYLLSGGKDCTVRLWDLTTYRPLFQINYGTPAAPQHRARLQTRFSFNEDFILTSDEITCSILVFDTRTQELSQRLSGHNQVVRWIAVSPTDPYFVTCSDDNRARFWYEEQQHQMLPNPL